jgi:hypothetical protein
MAAVAVAVMVLQKFPCASPGLKLRRGRHYQSFIFVVRRVLLVTSGKMEFVRSPLANVRLRVALLKAHTARAKRGRAVSSKLWWRFALVFVTLLGIVQSQASSHDEPAPVCESFNAGLGESFWYVAL